jgi:hypothetical protein
VQSGRSYRRFEGTHWLHLQDGSINKKKSEFTIVWDMTPRILVEVCRRFGGKYLLGYDARHDENPKHEKMKMLN